MVQDLLTQAEFDSHLKSVTLRLAFVGMANVGKSFRSKVLAKDSGFTTYSVDDEIMQDLGLASMEEMAAWMGHPFSAGYERAEQEYLALEDMYTKSIAQANLGKNLVFDTTGSVIYTSDEAKQKLLDNALVVHIVADENQVQDIITQYFKEPKPVVWAGKYSKDNGETDIQALKRNFPELLRSRLEAYRQLAQVNIPFSELKDQTAAETLRIIRDALPR